MLGTVTKVSDSYITVQIAEHGDKAVEVVMQKASVSAVLPKGTIKAL
jgi:preprotein translocase subunit YajC